MVAGSHHQGSPLYVLVRYFLIAAVLAAASASPLLAQTFPIVLTTSVRPPYDPDLSVWEREPNRVSVTLRNTSTQTQQVRIGGSAKSDDGRVVITIKNNFPVTPITVPAGGTVTLSGRETNLFNDDAVTISGADRSTVARTRRLPDGNYTICLQALDASTLAELSRGEPQGCVSFTIVKPEAPRTLYPICDSKLDPAQTVVITFQWSPLTARLSDAVRSRLRYELTVVPWLRGPNALAALTSATDPLFFQQKGLTNTYFQYGPTEPKLTKGRLYAWRVRIIDPNDEVAFENNGYSAACWFLYGDSANAPAVTSCSPPSVKAQFPRAASTDTLRIPYRTPPVVAIMSPLCPRLRGFSSTLELKVNGSVVETYSREHTWRTSLIDSLRAQGDSSEPKPDSILLSPAATTNWSTWMLTDPNMLRRNELPPGVPIEWNAAYRVTLPGAVGSISTPSSGRGVFTVGMPRPLPSIPSDGAVIKPGMLRLQFSTGAAPPDSELVPATVVAAEQSRLITVPGSASVKEVWMIEVARTPFTPGTEVIQRSYGTVSGTLTFGTTVAGRADIYRTVIDGGFVPPGDGEYYWRVKWLRDNNKATPRTTTNPADTAAYTWSAVSRFTVDSLASEDGSISALECLRITPETPAGGAVWSTSRKPLFKVRIAPAFDSAAINGGRLQVWELKGDDKTNPQAALASKLATFDASFAGSVKSPYTLRATNDSNAFGRVYEVLFVNTAGAPKVFIGNDSAFYAWRFTLHLDVDARRDSVKCRRDSAVSSIGYFSLSAPKSMVSDTACLILTPLTPQTGLKIKTSKPVFSLRAEPVPDTSAIQGGTLKVWKMKSPTEKLSDVISRAPVFNGSFTGHSLNDIRATIDSGDMAAPLAVRFVNDTAGGNTPRMTFVAAYDTNYLWQASLKFDKNRIRTDGVKCIPDSVLSAYGTFRYDTTTGGPCPDSCSLTPPPTTLFAGELKAGDSIKVGRFTMMLSEASGTSAALSGQGTITIPFLKKIKIAVTFTGISVNAAGQMSSGSVSAKAAAGVTMPANATQAIGDALNLSNDELRLAFGAASDATRLLSNLVTGQPMQMPLGIDNTIEGGERMTIGITAMSFSATGATLTAVFNYPLPMLGPNIGIGLGAKGICFTPDGFGGGKKQLYLASDLGYKQDSSWGFRFKAPVSGGASPDIGTFVEFDCNGFSALRVKGQVEFPRAWMVPILPNGRVDSVQKNLVTADFIISVKKDAAKKTDSLTKPKRSTQWLAAASITPFAPAEMPDLQFTVTDMTIDMSDLENPTSMVFPTGYRGELTERWRGFYLKTGSVRLPDALKVSGNDTPPAIALRNVLIDRSGISGMIESVNAIPDGNFGGWSASLDTIRLAFVNNIPSEFKLAGKIGLPVASVKVNYAGIVSYDKVVKAPKFILTLNTADSITASGWPSKIKLNGTATVTVEKNLVAASASNPKPPAWKVTATLSGGMDFSTSSNADVPAFNLRGFSFTGFGISSIKPYLQRGTWSFAGLPVTPSTDTRDTSKAVGGVQAPRDTALLRSQPGLAGFPLSLTGFDVFTEESGGKSMVGVKFNINLNLMKNDSSNGVGGATRVKLYSQVDFTKGQKFVYDHGEVDSIGIDAKFGPTVQVKGTILLYKNNATYGSGFYGAVDINVLNRFNIKGILQVGSIAPPSKSSYRYFLVDFQGLLAKGVPIGATGVSFYGAGGGVWYHMKRGGTDPDVTKASAFTPAIGRSLSGYTYAPDEGTLFGFRVMATLGATVPETFNGDLAIEAEITSSGGLGRITLQGKGYMMAPVLERSKAKIKMDCDLTYTPPEELFHGVFRLSLDIASMKAAGDIVLHVDGKKNKWYLKFGEPAKPITVTSSWMTGYKGYLMIGNDIPGIPPLPAIVQQAFGGSKDYDKGRSSDVGGGKGIAFGGGISFNSGRKDYKIFYGQISGTLGFDAAFFSGTNCPGINNWYAVGQIYAGFDAKVGIHVDIWFYSGDVEIFSATVGAALTGGFPNPSWVEGKVAGRYRILSGAVKGKFNYQFTKGEKCVPSSDALDQLRGKELISGITPATGSTKIDPTVIPEAAFNMAVNQTIDIEELKTDGTTYVRHFRVVIDDFSIKRSGSLQPGTVTVAADGYSAKLYPRDIMAGNTSHSVSATAKVEEYKSYKWTKVPDISTTKSTSFTTGPAPDRILPGNVAWSWPLDRQRHYMQDESNVGRVQLKQGQPDLFRGTPSTKYETRWQTILGIIRIPYVVAVTTYAPLTVRAIFTPVDGSAAPTEVGLSYDEGARTANYTVPRLTPNKVYRVDLLTRDSAKLEKSTITIDTMSRLQVTGGDTVQTTASAIKGLSTRPGEKVLYSWFFKTSNYNKLSDKLATLTSANRAGAEDKQARFQFLRNVGEGFDDYECKGVQYSMDGRDFQTAPLIEVNAPKTTTPWHSSALTPNVDARKILNREVGPFLIMKKVLGILLLPAGISYWEPVEDVIPAWPTMTYFTQTQGKLGDGELASGAADPGKSIEFTYYHRAQIMLGRKYMLREVGRRYNDLVSTDQRTSQIKSAANQYGELMKSLSSDVTPFPTSSMTFPYEIRQGFTPTGARTPIQLTFTIP